MVTIDFKLADVRVESSEAYLLIKVSEESVVAFRSYFQFS